MRRIMLAMAAGLMLGGAAPHAQEIPPQDPDDYPAGFFDATHNDAAVIMPTRVISLADLNRIAAPKGLTLQWIDWNERGPARVLVDGDGQWMLTASQGGADGAYVGVDGVITEIGHNYFELTGTITILNTPDAQRTCRKYDNWRFEITQNRKYYRLRNFEWCDDLTDYIDIYF